MTTSASICNIALARIGVKQVIASLADDSSDARLCARFYDQTRLALLREFPWAFCERYYTVALVEVNPNPRWDFSYRYPVDVVRVNDLVSDERNPNPKIPFKIGSDANGKLIYCDTEDAVFACNADIEDVTQFDPLFVDAFAWRLAMEMAGPLSKDEAFVIGAKAGYEVAIRRAVAVSMNEEGADEEESSLTQARE